jgi:fructose-1,6-bisphosphatase II / sedoheptulose-1,7-bisphosphatase
MLDHNMHFEIMKATEAAAVAAHSLMGRGDEKLADQVAVDAMRSSLNTMSIDGTIVIGEGERDKAPMLYIGEKVGAKQSQTAVDIALDPLEGTTILATGGNNALSVIAITEAGGFLHAPDVYMDKIAIGFDFQERIIDLDNSPAQNLKNIALAKKCDISDLRVMILDRKRHQELIAKVREVGVCVHLIKDGDVAAVIATAMPETGIDAYIGIGGAPEGVLAAAALCATGGQICGRLLFENDADKERARRMGISDLKRQYTRDSMASGDVIFVATGVTDGSMVRGVQKSTSSITTHSIVMRANARRIFMVTNTSRI